MTTVPRKRGRPRGRSIMSYGQFNVRIRPEQAAWIEQLAAEWRVTKSVVLRTIIDAVMTAPAKKETGRV